MFCKNCGQELDEGSNFCSHCGADQSDGVRSENAYIFGRALGAIGMLAATNAAVDKMNQDADESMRRTLQKGRDSLGRIQEYLDSQNKSDKKPSSEHGFHAAMDL